ncbi:glycosyltransferase family 25 protein [Paracoccus niistensis]|uniref:Glycosyltransferase family 25 protein n=1 Tax=Paracoccus niistensis TaxID=632935 RepID=A0ABV6I5E7_9RHOB
METADTSLAVRILTLPGATDRQTRMREVMQKAEGLKGAPWQFHHAVPHEGSALAYDDRSAHAAGRTLSAAELSCFVSHIGIISSWLEDGASDVLLVLEDDVYLDPWFDFQAAAALAHSTGLDYLRLYARVWMPARQIIYRARTQIVRFTWTLGGMQAFMLTRQGAQRIIDAVTAAGRIVRPVDDLIDRYWEVRNPVYALFPSPVLEHCMPTLIHLNEQVKARQKKQAELDRMTQAVGLSRRLQSKVGALADRLARRKIEKEMRHEDIEVAARLQSYMNRPDFHHFRISAPAVGSSAFQPPAGITLVEAKQTVF